MATIHLIQQGKGGVGKSMVAIFLYQALQHFGKTVVAFDTDPVNATLAGFREFDVKRLEILKHDNIDPRAFDALLEGIFELPEDVHVIVDNGASSFLALGSYIKENDVIQLLRDNGHTVFFHTIVVGGQAINDTLSGLRLLAVNFSDCPIVVWLNTYFGEIRLDGKEFHEFVIFQEYGSQFHAIVTIPEGNQATLGKDLEELFAKRQSFMASINSNQSIAVRSRLKRHWGNLLSAIEAANIV